MYNVYLLAKESLVKSGRIMNILLIEDNNLDAYLIDDIIKRINKTYNVIVKTDAKSALEFFNELKSKPEGVIKPDLIILDLVLPDLSGFEVLRQIKEDEEHRKIPVIVFSASMSEDDKIKSLHLGAVVYFRKPENLTDYTDAVVSFINLFSV
ncbi:MAG: response regulator [Bacillota bacterium]